MVYIGILFGIVNFSGAPFIRFQPAVLSKTSFGKKRSPAGILTNFPEKMVQSECNQPKIVVKVIGSSVLASHK